MAIKFEKIVPGMKLYDRHKDGSALPRMAEWSVHIVSVDAVNRTAMVSWNSNAETMWSERRLTKLYTWSKSQRDRQKKAEAEKARQANVSIEGY